MSERTGAFVGGVILAVALISCVLVKLTPAAPRQLVLDPKDAMVATVPFTVDDQGRRIAWFTHECCQCSSVHRVAVTSGEEGIEMYWWADEGATRKARRKKGMLPPDPWAAESGRWGSTDR